MSKDCNAENCTKFNMTQKMIIFIVSIMLGTQGYIIHSVDKTSAKVENVIENVHNMDKKITEQGSSINNIEAIAHNNSIEIIDLKNRTNCLENDFKIFHKQK